MQKPEKLGPRAVLGAAAAELKSRKVTVTTSASPVSCKFLLTPTYSCRNREECEEEHRHSEKSSFSLAELTQCKATTGSF